MSKKRDASRRHKISNLINAGYDENKIIAMSNIPEAFIRAYFQEPETRIIKIIAVKRIVDLPNVIEFHTEKFEKNKPVNVPTYTYEGLSEQEKQIYDYL